MEMRLRDALTRMRLTQKDVPNPHLLSWEAQETLLALLPPYLADVVLFAVNTGCRAGEIGNLRWAWEERNPLDERRSVFVIPAGLAKMGRTRLVVLNTTACQVVEQQRGRHPEFVFTHRNQPLQDVLKSWRKASESLKLSMRLHDFRHTFSQRLMAADVSDEDRQDLLGLSPRMTHYSCTEALHLFLEAETISERGNKRKPQISVLSTPPELRPNSYFDAF